MPLPKKFEQANNLKDALKSYSKAIAADPAYEKAYTVHALLYEKQNQKAEAVEDYKKLIANPLCHSYLVNKIPLSLSYIILNLLILKMYYERSKIIF